MRKYRHEEQLCPCCGAECGRDEADVGIGIMYGPWGCGGCGWSENPDYDSREGVKRDGDRVLDQYGSSSYIEGPDGQEVLAEAWRRQ